MNGRDLFGGLISRPPLSALPPSIAGFLEDYLSAEKARLFDGRWVINTHLPPYPSRAFEGLMAQLGPAGARARRLFSVTWAVTNRCDFACWHCYNAHRAATDLPLARLRQIAQELQEQGASLVTLGGGEPLLRPDLEQIASAFDDRVCLTMNTTGWGLSESRARRLREAGVFAMGVSLDSELEAEHDQLRGRPGAFRAALTALTHAARAGLFPYAITVARRELLRPGRLARLMERAAGHGALEVNLIEPSATGRLKGRRDVLLTSRERRLIEAYQRTVARRDDLPVLSSFTYLESPRAFGCGAGLTHIYIDGSGEVSPCNLVPLSFGNLAREDLVTALGRLARHFQRPRTACVGRLLGRHVPEGGLPTPPEVSERLCAAHLPQLHPLPRFFRLRSQAADDAGHAATGAGHQEPDACCASGGLS